MLLTATSHLFTLFYYYFSSPDRLSSITCVTNTQNSCQRKSGFGFRRIYVIIFNSHVNEGLNYTVNFLASALCTLLPICGIFQHMYVAIIK
jgi:hypothetical protein